MRKHKSVVAILLAVMMIFTFMPTMAFASVTQGGAIWADDLQSATNSSGQSVTVKKAATENYDGLTTATAWENNKEIAGSAVYYYDLTDAEIDVTGPLSNEAYKALANAKVSIKVKNPSGTGTVIVDGDEFAATGWTVKYKVDTTLDNTTETEAKIDVEFKATDAKSDMNGTSKEHSYLYKTIATKTVTVRAKTDAVVNEFYELNERGQKAKVGGAIYANYDGKEHKVMIDEKKGYSLKTYKWLTSGSWEEIPASNISYKDYAETVYYKAVFKKTDVDVSGEGKIEVPLEVTVGRANRRVQPSMAWTRANARTQNNQLYYDLTESQAADPTAYIEFANDFGYSKDQEGYNADVDELKTVFNELYTVDVKKNAIDANQQTWTIVKKTGSDTVAWEKAYKETKTAHKTLFANYSYLNSSYNNDGLDGLNASVTVVVKADKPVVNDKDDDITFTGVTTKSFKAKKKTKKLAKNKSFQVAATAASGNAVTFTATSSNGKVSIDATGKVTVKKGLKKGAKVKLVVKAQTAAGNGYKAVSAEKTYTIKVK